MKRSTISRVKKLEQKIKSQGVNSFRDFLGAYIRILQHRNDNDLSPDERNSEMDKQLDKLCRKYPDFAGELAAYCKFIEEGRPWPCD